MAAYQKEYNAAHKEQRNAYYRAYRERKIAENLAKYGPPRWGPPDPPEQG